MFIFVHYTWYGIHASSFSLWDVTKHQKTVPEAIYIIPHSNSHRFENSNVDIKGQHLNVFKFRIPMIFNVKLALHFVDFEERKKKEKETYKNLEKVQRNRTKDVSEIMRSRTRPSILIYVKSYNKFRKTKLIEE